GIGNAKALTGDALMEYVKQLRAFLRDVHPNQAEARLALEALDAGKVKLVVSNAFAGEAARFTKGLFDKGLHAFDVRMLKLFYPLVPLNPFVPTPIGAPPRPLLPG